MAWHNGGSWINLSIVNLADILQQIMYAINERQEMLGFTERVWPSPVSTTYPSRADVVGMSMGQEILNVLSAISNELGNFFSTDTHVTWRKNSTYGPSATFYDNLAAIYTEGGYSGTPINMGGDDFLTLNTDRGYMIKYALDHLKYPMCHVLQGHNTTDNLGTRQYRTASDTHHSESEADCSDSKDTAYAEAKLDGLSGGSVAILYVQFLHSVSGPTLWYGFISETSSLPFDALAGVYVPWGSEIQKVFVPIVEDINLLTSGGTATANGTAFDLCDGNKEVEVGDAYQATIDMEITAYPTLGFSGQTKSECSYWTKSQYLYRDLSSGLTYG